MVMLQQCVGGRFLGVRSVHTGGLESKDCVISVKEVVCVNCRVDHVAGDQKCPVRERRVEIAMVRVVEKVLYALAVKKVVEAGSGVKDTKRLRVVEFCQYRVIGIRIKSASVRLAF
jgi:hypothetical protein